MNYILDKLNSKVLWVNSEPQRMSGGEAWSEFNPEKHRVVFSPYYSVPIGEKFIADSEEGVVKAFTPSMVFNKLNGNSRVLLDWNDQIDPESETSEEPLIDSFGMKIPFQRFTDEVGWCIDLTAWKEFLLNQNSAIFNSKIKAYRGTVSCLDAQWDSGKKYLENISKTLSLLSKGKIEIIPPWRDADDQFHILDASGLSELADEIDLDLFNQGLVLYGKKWENENAIRDLSEYGQIDVLQMWESP